MNQPPVAQMKISPVFDFKAEISSVFVIVVKIRPVFENFQGSIGEGLA